jgi:uncharacterized membrane protein YGL010W
MKFPRPKHTLRQYIALYESEHKHLGTKLTHMIGIPMIVAALPMAFVHTKAAAGLFVGGWALQYVGHYVFEGNKPAFYGDPYYLLVGPLWVAAEWMQAFGLAVPEGLRGEVSRSPACASNGDAGTAVS